MSVQITCPKCNGWGKRHELDWDTLDRALVLCKTCGGTAVIATSSDSETDSFSD